MRIIPLGLAAIVLAAASFSVPAFAQYGGSPDQQVDGPAPPPASSRAVPGDQADADRNIDRDVDSDIDVDPDNVDDPYVSVEPGGPGDPSVNAASAPASHADGYVRLRPGDHYDPGGGSPYRPLVPRDPKDQDWAGQGAPDDQYDAEDSGPDDSTEAYDKGEGSPDPADDEDSPPAR